MTKRAAISKKTRFEVMKRDSFKCQYCGRAAPDVVLVIDHIHPVADGGENEITNLITSCFDCNAGKSDRKLSDSTIIAKRKKQLDELQARREQIEMMASWQMELVDIEDKAVEEINSLWERLTDYGGSLSDAGNRFFRGLIKKFGFSEVMNCLQISANQYLRFIDGVPEKDSAEKAINYTEKILRSRKSIREKPYLLDVYYIRAILANKYGDYLRKDWKITNLIESAYLIGIKIDDIKGMAINSYSLSGFKKTLEQEIENHG